ncbi:MAG TPA: PSD1 and planctomycete cytochrome C domain-containing protein, partial [Gemmataceae bacterium]
MPPRRLAFALAAVAILGVFTPPRSQAADPSPEQAAFFEQKVRPILRANCYTCHSHAAQKSKGGLVLDSRGSALKGGDTGPAIVPGKPDESLLVQAIGQTGDLKMPPKGKLADEQIAVLKEWVRQGAPWPETGIKIAARPRGVITDEDRRWWAFQPMKAVEPSAVADPAWNENPIDRFVRAKLDAAGLSLSPPADRRALIRRVTFDLTGLPPTPADVEAFVNNESPDAYERLVDRLLDSPRYGERAGRLWLDVVRYAESDGFRIDDYRAGAWRFRDYVIRSFNADKPYDRFLKEQLAGDEIAPDDPDALVAVGFLRNGIYEYNNRDVRGQRENMLNELADCVGDAFLGLGMGCARCHDHKFDPILQKDYFRLRAVFAGLSFRDDWPVATERQIAEHRARLAAWEEATKEVRAKIEALEAPMRAKAEREAVAKFADDLKAVLATPPEKRTPQDQQIAELAYRQVLYEFNRLDRKFKDEQKQQLVALRKELAKFDSRKPPPLPEGLTARDVGPVAAPTVIPKKGGGEPVEPGVPTIFDPNPLTCTPGESTTGRRTALADWLTRPDHPLTARVAVNRAWQQHFGVGLVATASDFGRLGQPPSHPELLDWLARRFVADGWSFKKLHRLVVTSQTYRQSALHPAPAAAKVKDPENRLLWRATTRRLDAEEVRDALLAATG